MVSDINLHPYNPDEMLHKFVNRKAILQQTRDDSKAGAVQA